MKEQTAFRRPWAAAARAGFVGVSGLGVTSIVLTGLLRLGRTAWPMGSIPQPTTDEVVAGLLVWTGVGLCGWLALGATLAAASCLPGALGAACTELAQWLTPRVLRQGVAVLLGTAVGTVCLPTGAASGIPPHTRLATQVRSGSAPWPVLEPGFRPAATVPAPDFIPTARPEVLQAATVTPTQGASGTGAPDPRFRPTPPTRVLDADESRLLARQPRPTVEPESVVIVRRGDSLWSIVARHLGPEASDLDIARSWPRWHAVNRHLIGPDPDLLIPGQQLHPPTGDAP